MIFWGVVIAGAGLAAGAVPGYLTMRLTIMECPHDISEYENSTSCTPALVSTPLELLTAAKECAVVMSQDPDYSRKNCELEAFVQGPYFGMNLTGSKKDIETSIYGDFRGYRLTALVFGGIHGPWEYQPRNALVSIGPHRRADRSSDGNYDAYQFQTSWATCQGNIRSGVTLTLDKGLNILHEDSVIRLRLPLQSGGGGKGGGGSGGGHDIDLSSSWSRSVTKVNIHPATIDL